MMRAMGRAPADSSPLMLEVKRLRGENPAHHADRRSGIARVQHSRRSFQSIQSHALHGYRIAVLAMGTPSARSNPAWIDSPVGQSFGR